MVVIVVLGWLCIAITAMLGRHTHTLDDQLREHLIGEQSPNTRWPSQPRTLYRPADWPILEKLRTTMGAVYTLGVLGVVLVMYACPAVEPSWLRPHQRRAPQRAII